MFIQTLSCAPAGSLALHIHFQVFSHVLEGDVYKHWFTIKQLSYLFIFVQLNMLPSTPGVKETFIGQFLKLLKLRALTLAKYVDAEP